jgi:UDP-glucose 4-epimerase
VDDVVECNLAALQPNVEGIYNVGTGIETDVNTIAEVLIRLTGATSVDRQPLHAAARPGEQRRSCLKPGALQKLPPTDLVSGLRKTVEWFRARA